MHWRQTWTINEIKVYSTFNHMRRVAGVLISSTQPLSPQVDNHWSLLRMASVMRDLRLPSQPQDIAVLQLVPVILLRDRGIYVWTTCPRSLPSRLVPPLLILFQSTTASFPAYTTTSSSGIPSIPVPYLRRLMEPLFLLGQISSYHVTISDIALKER